MPAATPPLPPPADPAELLELARLSDEAARWSDAGIAMQRLGEVVLGDARLPLLAMALGNPSPQVPGLGVFGGVHGVERIGAQVVLAWLRSLLHRLRWDESLHRQLERVRLVVLPLVNPGGLVRGTRANPNGVDLMRNAPVEGDDGVPWLLGGHRLGPRLPWFRGLAGEPMQAEAQALCRLVETELLPRPCSLVADCHSGFGLQDRLWFPYAHTARPFPHLAEMHAFCEILDQAQVHHPYLVEPQSRQYRAHGDLWDHLVLQGQRLHPEAVFLPLTLEMGSWLWVRKNPRQLFAPGGLYNPVIAHRHQRVLRRQLGWLDFLLRAAAGAPRWLPTGPARAGHHAAAVTRWYRGRTPPA